MCTAVLWSSWLGDVLKLRRQLGYSAVELRPRVLNEGQLPPVPSSALLRQAASTWCRVTLIEQ